MSEKETLTSLNDGIRLLQNPDGLVYGTDALLLAAFLRPSPKALAAEIGSGCGMISLLVAKHGKCRHIDALEIQEEYAALTARNCEANGLSDTVTAVCTDVRNHIGSYDLLFMNPPYMTVTCGRRNENDGKYAARHEVNGTITELCGAAARLLKTGGDLYVVYRPDRLTDLLDAMRQSKIEPKRLCFVHPTAEHKPCLVLVAGKRGGKSGCDVLRPLFLTDRDGNRTPDAAAIYQTGEWVD